MAAIKRMLINAAQPDELRVAVTDDSQLVDLDIEAAGQEQKKSNIYKAVITSIEPSLGAVFADYEKGARHGFLPIKEISSEYFLTEPPEHIESADIYKLLKLGQELVVQIDKEERDNKGAALTTFISLAGSFLVLMPNNPQAGGISRRIEGEERDQLREAIHQLNLPEGMGVIVRTAGLGKSKEELEWDLNILLHYWEAIKQAAVAKAGPYLIHQESNIMIRAIRDHLRHDVTEIIVDQEKAFQQAQQYIRQIRPDFADRLKLYHDKLPLFSRFQIEQQIESAYQREVRLPSGGSLVIDHTEALVTIDINSARATRGGNIEETAFHTNLEAADEIARQLRIRDIGGLVVIDFIDMTPVRNQRELETRLRNAVRHDRARIQIGRISRFGLLEMSRQRLRTSLIRATQVPCPRCDGQGNIRSVESLGLSIIHLIQEQAAKVKNVHFQIQLPVDLATYLVNEKRELLKEIEYHCPVKITIIPNQYLESPHYQLKQIKVDPTYLEHSKGIPSYRLAKILKADYLKRSPERPTNEPAVNQFLTPTPTLPLAQKQPNTGLFKRLIAKMLGSDSSPKSTAKITTPSQDISSRESPYSTPHDTQGRPYQGSGYRRHGGGNYPHHPSSRTRHRSRRGSRGGQRRHTSSYRTPFDDDSSSSRNASAEEESPAHAPKDYSEPPPNNNV